MVSKAEAGRIGYEKVGARLRARSALLAQQARARYEANPKQCACGTVLTYAQREGKYCGSSCAAKATNPRRKCIGRSGCPRCGAESRPGRFCSQRCAFAARWSAQIELIESTGTFPSDRVARRYLIERFGCKCSACSLHEWRGQPIPMILDHRDGDSTNRATSNLRLLCPNCDAQTPTWKGKNKGRGRAYRRQRYHAGKSY